MCRRRASAGCHQLSIDCGWRGRKASVCDSVEDVYHDNLILDLVIDHRSTLERRELNKD